MDEISGKFSAISINGSSGYPSPVKSSLPSTNNPETVYLGRQRRYVVKSSPASVNNKHPSVFNNSVSEMLNDGLNGVSSPGFDWLSEDQKEYIRFGQVTSKKDFFHVERVNGRPTNVLHGLELHTDVFSSEEQKKIVECVHNLQRMGKKGQLRARTYSEPRKTIRGNGRVTIQFGCCYNYAVDKNGNPPGIIRDEEVDPMPPLFKQMIKRLVRWHVLHPAFVPNSCIVNMYDEGICIPPHIDHHDFLRPFCTISFLNKCDIMFGASLRAVRPGEFVGPVSIPLPVGSVLVLKGNGADIAKHCVPCVPAKRISITFRKMDESKLPYNYLPDPELISVKPLMYTPLFLQVQQNQHEQEEIIHGGPRVLQRPVLTHFSWHYPIPLPSTA
ncbi:RNA demethylase ALKBH9B-like [Cornus florida]|uniref:RNA demethylase ALKBH9B-like n=1 Tax=Cornus florida TaxID=4283 RepID=UPI00289A0D2A|nr:RNA demethylase ALKBH9B-like [Cornus florida]